MKRRAVIIAMSAAALIGTAAAAQADSVPLQPVQPAGYVACAGTWLVDVGVCVKNPLPERLPTTASVDQ